MQEIISIFSLKVVKESCEKYNVPKRIKSPEDVYIIFQEVLDLKNEPEEKFCMLTLDTKNAVTGLFIVSHGILNLTTIHPREVFKRALLQNAYAIIVCHNHPSGDCTPSKDDLLLTDRLIEAGKIIGIPVLDHIIIGNDYNIIGDHYISFKQKGYCF